ncbi:Potassium efflux system KefA protein / Small-conductance mechanosensitive channel [Caballeronia glathei]|nr:Potassium efflux system KefA protein / Small-conductance mechanosensitive channel [Caballeronia glathei]
MNASTGHEPGSTLIFARSRTCPVFRGRCPRARPFQARAWRAAWIACVWLAVSSLVLATPRVTLAAGTPLSAGLQRLVDGTKGASAPSASTAQAASAPSAASQAELARSLDNLIGTLDNDAQRTALVSQLKKQRDAAQGATQGTAQGVAPEVPAEPKRDLLGTIASGIASVEANLNEGRTPLHYWSGRARAAASELKAIVAGERGEPFGQVILGMLVTLAAWGACAAILFYGQRRIRARYRWDVSLVPNPTSLELLSFGLRQTGPWIAAFLAVLLFVGARSDALGYTLGLVMAYSIVAGAVFSALCTIVFSVFGTAHRRVAVQLLLPRARSLLFVIGACGALGDAASNPDVTQLLGANLAGLVSTFANMAAAISSAYFALAYRRPVAHLIRNRAYIHRHDHKLATEALEILASLWHIPILLIAIAAIIAMIDGRGMEGGVLQPSLVSALLLVLTLFLSALLLHLTRARNSRAQRRTPHLMRLLRFGGMLLIFGIWLAYIRFELDLWSGPVARLLKHGAMTPGVKYTLIALTTTVFGAWFVWILIDTIILEALSPSSARAKSLDPGVRGRTILPLVRNAMFVIVVTIAAFVVAASLGVNLTPLLAGAGVIGLAAGFGAKSLVTDLITGLFIIAEETISVGDWIDIDGGHAGTVIDLTIRTVRLRDGQGAIHTIPFSQIKIVKNLSRDFAYAVFEVRVAFSVEMDEVRRLIVEVGAEMMADARFRNEILGPVEVWGLDRFDANWMLVKGQFKTRPLQQWSVARAFNERLKRKMDDAGIEIPMPQMQVHTLQKPAGGSPMPDNVEDDESRGVYGADVAIGYKTGTTTPSAAHVQEPPRTRPAAG